MYLTRLNDKNVIMNTQFCRKIIILNILFTNTFIKYL